MSYRKIHCQTDIKEFFPCFFSSFMVSGLTFKSFIQVNFLKDFIYLFLERGKGKEKEGNIKVWLPLTHPLLGTWPTTQACTLAGNPTSDPLVCRPALNPLSHTSQAWLKLIFVKSVR